MKKHCLVLSCLVLETSVSEKDTNIQKVTEQATELMKENVTLKEKVEALEEEVEERTNRSLRSTLIFKNVKCTGKETWAETTTKAAEAINTVSRGKISFDEAHDMLERCHRGKPRKSRGNSSSPTPIYALIDDWRNAEMIKEAFMTKPKDVHIYCDQKYGKRTTWRRNQALQVRKELKRTGEIVSGYVKYPAILMVCKQQRHGQKKEYEEYDNFSSMPVVFDEQTN